MNCYKTALQNFRESPNFGVLEHLDIVADAESDPFCVGMVAVEVSFKVCNVSTGQVFPSLS